jgi:hypothetical protein
MNSMVAQLENCPFEVNTAIELNFGKTGTSVI